LALTNLIIEELDWIEHNNHVQVNFEQIKKHRETVRAVKINADSWI